jgi:pimeloyl-ACP methyl ester carboxylesterase
MRARNIILLVSGLFLVLLSIYQIAAAQRGLRVIHLHTTNPPITIIAPADSSAASKPTVLIAHGFAGSALLMRGFAFTFAHAGYTTVSWDFEGHGANPNPFVLSAETDHLLTDAESALSLAVTTGLVDNQRVAILGHSMGSGVAIDYGVAYPETDATIAISPVPRDVTPELPHNLLLMAGSLEPQFVETASKILAQAGGENRNFTSGTARQLTIIPGVEHISILFSPASHAEALSWLDATFGRQPGAISYTDNRMLWFILGILGFIFIANALVNSLPSFASKTLSFSLRRRLLAIPLGALAATIILWLVSRFGIDLSQVFGLLVGGYVMVWFSVAGLISVLIIKPRLYLPKSIEIAKALIVFTGLWLGVGLLGNYVWLPWLLIPQRLILWLPGSVLLLVWFYSAGEASKSAGAFGQVGWWIVQVFAVAGGLFLALTISPGLGFIFLILPLVPLILGLPMLAISSRHGSWAYALPAAMFTAWLLLAVFPLQ